MERLAIVILNYNGVKFLDQFLPSVIKYSGNHKIVVADNASIDDSVKLLREKFPEVEIMQLPENYGFCGGYNRALQNLESEYYLLLNSDIEVTEGWLEPMLEMMDGNKGIAAVQPKIRSYHDKELFEYAGAAGGFIDKYGYPFCRGRIFDVLEKDEGQYDSPLEIFWATGACLLIRAELFHAAKGFDEYFFAHMEEIDLCWRLKNKGYKIMYCPKSIVFHVGGGTLPKNNPRKVYYNFRNSLFLLLKNLPADQVVKKIFIRLCLDFPAAVSYLTQGAPKSFWSIFRAHIGFYSQLPRYIRERNGQKKKPHLLAGYYRKSLLIKYYFTGVRKFSNL